MIKKCRGCGVALQSDDKEKLGYTPNIKNNYCMRCFRLKNYGEANLNEVVDEEAILNKVNHSHGLAFFFLDYLNINRYTLSVFEKIKIKKVLVINKVDVLRKDMKFIKIKKWLEEEYKIKDDILFLSNKTGFGTSSILDIAFRTSASPIYIMGITNAGKSTFINHLLKDHQKQILTSKKPNTTLDFMKFQIEGITLFDTPGFSYPNMSSELITREIKPITYQIKKPTTLSFGTYRITFLTPTSVTSYLTIHQNLKRDYKVIEGTKMTLKENQDLVLIGYGFLNVKNAGEIIVNQEVEVRSSLSGVTYE